MIASMIRRVVCSIAVALLATTSLYAMPSDSIGSKVLVITSYGSDYQWSNTIIDGFKDYMESKRMNIDLNVEFLTSEIYTHPKMWVDKIQAILNNYDEHKPAAIVLISDEAWMGYRAANLEGYEDVPVVLCAVKPLSIDIAKYTKTASVQLSDFTPTQTVMKQMGSVTGILREINIDANVKLMQKVIPNIDGIALITDNRFYGIYCQLLFRELMKNYPNLTPSYYDGRKISTDSLLTLLPQISSTTAVMLTSWLTGEHGPQFSKEYVYQKMQKVIKTPIFITNNIGMEKNYFLGGYFVNSLYWGDQAAQMVDKIVNGESVDAIPVKTYMAPDCQINYPVLKRFKISEKLLPASVIMTNKPESVIVRYWVEIVIVSLIMLIITISLIILSRAYLHLRIAQKSIIELNAQTQQSNLELTLSRRQLEIALDKAQESDKLKSAFLANMSHEIRTPLNAIVGFSELICSHSNNEEIREYQNIVAQNNDILLRLIDDVLDLSKIESGTYNFRFSSVNIAELIGEYQAIFNKKLKHGVELLTEIPNEPFEITTDRKRVGQILSNFISNAIKFTSEGSVTVGYAKQDDKVYIYVRDTGCGIPEDKLEHIFERFVKLNDFEQGTGLGLPICKEIVERLGGRIGVESKVGVGSTFWATIPQ